jgi:hypothetical protein
MSCCSTLQSFPETSRSRLAGRVVRVGEDTISSMVLSISCSIEGAVTAGSPLRVAVLKAGTQAKDKSQARRTCS